MKITIDYDSSDSLAAIGWQVVRTAEGRRPLGEPPNDPTNMTAREVAKWLGWRVLDCIRKERPFLSDGEWIAEYPCGFTAEGKDYWNVYSRLELAEENGESRFAETSFFVC